MIPDTSFAINLIYNSFAKLNLYLAVLNKRKDSFHNIEALFERIGLSDKIILKTRRDKKINLVCGSRSLPKDPSKNLVYQSARLLQDTLKIEKGIDIKLIKRIPVAAGLGGGSSNAATTLIGLNKAWKANLKPQELAAIAARIGSDVPFFIYDTPFAYVCGRGEKVKPLKMLNTVKLWHVLIVPEIKVSTPFIYNEWDKLNKGLRISKILTLTPHLCSIQKNKEKGSLKKLEYFKGAGLTRPAHDVKIMVQALRKRSHSLIARSLFNSLQQSTVKLYPEVRRINERLLGFGLDAILMSGSGPAVFAIVSSRKEALSIAKQLRKHKPWRVFVVRTR